MKNTDKVTLTLGQIKRLIKESHDSMEGVMDNLYDQIDVLDELIDLAKRAKHYADELRDTEENRFENEDIYSDLIKNIVGTLKKIKTFDVIYHSEG